MYKFNDCGVCTNPEKIEILQSSCIELCEYDNKWFIGYDLNYISGGSSSPCSIKGEQYNTKDEAKNAAFRNAIKCIEAEAEWYKRAISGSNGCNYKSSLKQCFELLAILKDRQVKKPRIIQLSLFD